MVCLSLRIHYTCRVRKANTAGKSKEWPKAIRHGNASVKLYKVKSGDYTLYTLAWRGADGKRKLRQFADEKEA